MKSYSFRGAASTDIGCTRKDNEDAYNLDDDLGLYVVADGMGGAAHGEVASQIAVEAVFRTVSQRKQEIDAVKEGRAGPETLGYLLGDAVRNASKAVFEQAGGDSRLKGMGSTLTCLLCVGTRVIMAHVGDSLLYLLRQGELHQLSMDHTMAMDLHLMGAITKEKVKTHPYSHVLSRVVGNQSSVHPDVETFKVLPGDRLLLCTDGLKRTVIDAALLANKLQGELGGVATGLVKDAVESGGQDNITVVVVTVEPAEAEQHSVDLFDESARIEALRSTFLFADLEFARISMVLSSCIAVQHQPGDVLVSQGGVLSGLFLLLKGELAIEDPTRGNHILESPAVVGERSLLKDQRATCSITAQTQVLGLELSGQNFRNLVRSRTWLGRRLLYRLGLRLTDLLEDEMQHNSLPRVDVQDPQPV